MIIEYVWKREIFTDPLLPPGCDVGWCDRASLGGGSPIGRRARYSDGGRGPDWRRCRFTRKVRVRCNLWRLKRGDEKISSRLLYWRRGGGPDWRRCWFIRKVRERCCVWRLKRREKKNSSHLLQAFRRPSQDIQYQVTAYLRTPEHEPESPMALPDPSPTLAYTNGA